MAGCVRRRLRALGRRDGLHHLPRLARRKHAIMTSNQRVLGLSSGSCLNLTTSHRLGRRFLRALAPSAFLPASSSSHLLAKGFKVCRRLRARLTALFNARATLILGDNCRTGVKVLPTIDSTRALVLTSGLIRTDVVSNVHLSATHYVHFHRGSLMRLRHLLRRRRTAFQRLVVIARDVFDVSNSRTSLATLIHLGGECSGMLLCISRTRTFNMEKPHNLNYTRRAKYVQSVSFLINAFNGTTTSTNTCVTYYQAVHRCLIGQVQALVFAATLPPADVT